MFTSGVQGGRGWIASIARKTHKSSLEYLAMRKVAIVTEN